MVNQEKVIFSFEKNLQNAVPSYKKLIEMFHLLNSVQMKIRCIWKRPLR